MSRHYTNGILWLFESIKVEGHGYFMHDGATAHSTNYYINALNMALKTD
jgi:hypothetical protein